MMEIVVVVIVALVLLAGLDGARLGGGWWR